MKKNTVCLLTSALIAMGSLAACGGGSGESESKENPSSFDDSRESREITSNDESSEAGTSVVSFSEDDVPEEGWVRDRFDNDGNLIISFFGIDIDSLQNPSEDTKLILNKICEKFKVSFKFINGSATNWTTVLNQYIGGGDVPDIFFHELNQPMYSNLLDDHYLFNFEPYLNDYPNLKHAFERYDINALRYYFGGGLYGFPVVQNSDVDRALVNQHGMYYRRDWYTNLAEKHYKPLSGRDLKDPEDPTFNYENFYDLMEGFTLGDPDGNGEKDTYGYALTKDGGLYWFYPILSMFNAIPYGWHYDNVTEQWLPDCIGDNCKQALDYLADMFDKGYISRNYAKSLTQSEMKNEFINGYAGSIAFNTNYNIGEGILELMEQYMAPTGKALGDICRCMPIVTGVDGEKHMFGYPNNYGYRSIDNDVSKNKKKKIMEIMDYMLTEEGMTLLDYGIEGIHYQKGEDGQIISMLGKNSAGLNRSLYDADCAPGSYRIKGLVSWSTIIPTDIKHYNEQIQLIEAWDQDLLVGDPLNYCSVDTAYSSKAVALDDKAIAAFQYVVGDHTNEERNAYWVSFVEDYKKSGKSYIAAKNQSAEELGIKH